MKTVAVSLSNIANNLRMLGSGLRCGIGEIRIPALQPGSSIMPGKVNPVIPEAVMMVAVKVVGNDATIAWSGAGSNFADPTGLQVLKCRVYGRRPSCHPSSYQGRGCENGRSD